MWFRWPFYGMALCVSIFCACPLQAQPASSVECPRLLRVLNEHTARVEAEIDQSIVALRAGDLAALSKALGKMEEYHSIKLARHLALLVPSLVLLPGNDLQLLRHLILNLQKQEWNLLNRYLETDITVDESAGLSPGEDFIEFIEAFEEINYLRAASFDDEAVKGIWEAVRSHPVSYGTESLEDFLLARYLQLRSALSFSAEVKSELPMEILLADLHSEENRMLAISFSKMLYLNLELAARLDLSPYSIFARIYPENKSLPGRDVSETEVRELIEAVGADVWEGDSEDEFEENGDEEKDLDPLDFSAIAGISEEFREDDLEQDDEAYFFIKGLLNEIYTPEDELVAFNLEQIRAQKGFQVSHLYAAYHIEDQDPDSVSELYLTPLQLLVLAGRNEEALELHQFLVENRIEATIWLFPPHSYPLR